MISSLFFRELTFRQIDWCFAILSAANERPQTAQGTVDVIPSIDDTKGIPAEGEVFEYAGASSYAARERVDGVWAKKK